MEASVSVTLSKLCKLFQGEKTEAKDKQVWDL